MERQKGFTLIELIIVIVILGILAVTAAPQFFNFGSDARAATVRGLEGSMIAGSEMVFARSTIAGVENEEGSEVEIRGTDVPVRFGYPSFVPASGAPDESELRAQVDAIFNLEDKDWEYAGSQGDLSFRISPRGVNDNVEIADMDSIASCYVQYTAPSAAGSAPAISANLDNC